MARSPVERPRRAFALALASGLAARAAPSRGRETALGVEGLLAGREHELDPALDTRQNLVLGHRFLRKVPVRVAAMAPA